MNNPQDAGEVLDSVELKEWCQKLETEFDRFIGQLVNGLMQHRHEQMRAVSAERFAALAGSATMLCLGALVVPVVLGQGGVADSTARAWLMGFAILFLMVQVQQMLRADRFRRARSWAINCDYPDAEFDGVDGVLKKLKLVDLMVSRVADDCDDLSLPLPPSNGARAASATIGGLVAFICVEIGFALFGGTLGQKEPWDSMLRIAVPVAILVLLPPILLALVQMRTAYLAKREIRTFMEDSVQNDGVRVDERGTLQRTIFYEYKDPDGDEQREAVNREYNRSGLESLAISIKKNELTEMAVDWVRDAYKREQANSIKSQIYPESHDEDVGPGFMIGPALVIGVLAVVAWASTSTVMQVVILLTSPIVVGVAVGVTGSFNRRNRESRSAAWHGCDP